MPTKIRKKKDEDDDLGRQLVAHHSGAEEVPDLVAGRRDGHRDREDIVDEKSATRNHADLRPEELRGDEIAAASSRKVLDQIRVRDRDDGDRDGRHRDEDDRERAMGPEGPESLVRAVRGGREPVGSEADPREEGHQGDPMENVRIPDVARLAQEDLGDLAGLGHRGGDSRPRKV